VCGLPALCRRHTWAGVLAHFQGCSELFGGSCAAMLERCNALAIQTDLRAHRIARPSQGRMRPQGMCGTARCALGGSSEEIRRDCSPQSSEAAPPFPGSYASPPIPRSSSSLFRLKPTTNSPSTSVAGVEKTSSFSRSANADSSSPMLRSMNGISC